MLLSRHCRCEIEAIPAPRPVLGVLGHCRSRGQLHDAGPVAGISPQWSVGAMLPAQHGHAACLTLPGDTAGENLDIVVKKMCCRVFRRAHALSRAGGYVLAPETGAFSVS